VHRPSTTLSSRTPAVSSSQAALRHPESPAYRCFLPDLAGFTGLRRTGPGLQHHLPEPALQKAASKTGFDPAI